MKLVLTENEFHRLKDEVLIMPYGNGIYTVELRSGIKEVKKIEISIEIDDSHDVKSSNIADVKNAVSNFKQVQDEFPASDAFDNFPTTRSLTTDKNNAAISNYRDLLENHDFTHNQIINAIKYEVYWRKEASRREGDNKMKFMKSLPSWLNNPIHIKTQLRLRDKDETYLKMVESGLDPEQDHLNDIHEEL